LIEKFLSRKQVVNPQDLELQLELWAYVIAQHFSISIKEVHEMSPQQFEQSLVWTMVGRKEEEKAQKKQQKSSKGGSRETVSLDYNWAMEDF
tara:strand:- start:645 stop:920 length:276 start_codon:yes stop_codon:yes gene_type:complete